jgi:hypothetical protein
MLEVPGLLLRPPGPDGARAIVHAGTRQPLGFACRRPAQGLSRWLSGPIIEVHEEEDAPLLLTIRSPWRWSSHHQVRDAEGYLVGSLVGRFVFNEYDRCIAAASQVGDVRLVVRSPKGEALAELETTPDGVRLDFRPELAIDPFAKMLLLAAALRVPVGSEARMAR